MKLGILCPGQGSQNLAMLDFLKENEIAKNIINKASDILNIDLFTLDESMDIFQNILAQPLICATQIATYKAIKSSINPASIFAGYSLGELSVYGCNGSLELEEAILLAKKRAELMDLANKEKSALLSCQNLPQSIVKDLCKKANTFISIINVDRHFIIGGEIKNLENFKSFAFEKGAIIKPLSVYLASHTPLLKSASEDFNKALKESNFKNPIIPAVSSINNTFICDKTSAIETLSKQISQTIQWEGTLETLLEFGCDVILELGPGKALSKMVQKLDSNVVVRSTSDFKTLDGIISWINKNS
ncbi:MAG: acyltransferase domain-containing protein [Arcobacter sp.]|uniref:ACP S-malonyltransferase n=1 Tax=Arcobacter sp. TaxID=1872629 RepID=UPI003C794259